MESQNLHLVVKLQGLGWEGEDIEEAYERLCAVIIGAVSTEEGFLGGRFLGGLRTMTVKIAGYDKPEREILIQAPVDEETEIILEKAKVSFI